MARRVDSRLVGLDIMRTASILMVLATHSIGRLRPGRDASFLQKFAAGHYGVAIFFVISGFIITETILRREPDLANLSRRDFYVRRIGRLAPLAAAVLSLAAVLAIALPASPARAFVVRNPRAHFTWWFVLSFPLLFFNWARVIHGRYAAGWGVSWDVFWSLAIEEQFYLVYPAMLRRFGTGRRMVAILIAAIVAGPAFAVWAASAKPGDFGLAMTSSPQGFSLIAMGCLLALALRTRPAWPGPRASAAFVAGGGVLIAFTLKASDLVAKPYDRAWGPALVGLGAALALVGMRQLSARNIVVRLLAWPGELSYGLYILHGTVVLVLWSTLPRFPAFVGFAVFVAASLAVAWVSFRLLEVPANARIRARWGRRPSPLGAGGLR